MTGRIGRSGSPAPLQRTGESDRPTETLHCPPAFFSSFPTMPPRLVSTLLLALGCLLSPLEASGLRLAGSTTWAENIGRTAVPSDWRDAQTLQLLASWTALREWQTGLLTSGEVAAGFSRTPRFTQLDAVTAGASGQVRKKFGLGAYAPVMAFDAGLQARGARLDGDDGWTANAALTLSRRLTPAWRVSATGDWQQHDAASPIFDTRHHRVFGTITWDITDRWSLSHGQGRLWGAFTANASWMVWERALRGELGRHISDYYRVIPWGVTDAFGPGWVTYRVEGRVNFWWLELSPALGRDTALPLRYESRFSVNKVGIKYRQDIWSLQLLHRF